MSKNQTPIIQAATTGIGIHKYTVGDLAAATNEQGYTGLDVAACYGHLDKITGGVTADQLAAVRNHSDTTALHTAAGFGNIHQIRNGVTAEQLAAAVNSTGFSALNNAISVGRLEYIKGGLTAQQVLALCDTGSLAMLAGSGDLHLLSGGVSLGELATHAPGGSNQPALDALRKLIRWADEKNIEPLVNNLVACPEAIKYLSIGNPAHEQAMRQALNRNRNIEKILTPEWLSVLL